MWMIPQFIPRWEANSSYIAPPKPVNFMAVWRWPPSESLGSHTDQTYGDSRFSGDTRAWSTESHLATQPLPHFLFPTINSQDN